MKLIEAIAHLEGFYAPIIPGVPSNRPQRNNNPGDLDYEPFMVGRYGAMLEWGTSNPRFAHFPNPGMGFQALTDLLSGPHYFSLTVEQAINKYAPPVENNTTNYVEFVCKAVGCESTDLISSLL